MSNFDTLLLLLLRFGWIATHSTVAVLALSTSPNPNGKLEKAAIARFNNYDKLCKTCPTLLKPKVDTLTEMVVGLSPEERGQLFQAVALRLEQQQHDGNDGISSFAKVKAAEDVFRFQIGADVAYPADELTLPEILASSETIQNDDDEKVRGKMDKLRSKFESNKYKLSQVQALLAQTNRLLSKRAETRGTTTDDDDDDHDDTNDDDCIIGQITDPVVLHKTLELQEMTRSELEMQRLKCTAQKMKFEQKIAKAKLKLYQASLRMVTMDWRKCANSHSRL